MMRPPPSRPTSAAGAALRATIAQAGAMALVALALVLAGPARAQSPVNDDLVETEARGVAAATRMVAATVGLGSAEGDMLENGVASGVIVTPEGLILTVAHAMEGIDGEFTVLLADGRVTRARPLGRDRSTDAGMLQITAPGPWPHVEPGDSTALRIGDWVLAAGHADGIVHGRTAPVRLGRLRGVLRDGSFHRLSLLTDCTLQPGDSGGPLVDLDGRLVGIGMSISTDPRDNYSVPIEIYRRQWDQLRAGVVSGDSSTEPVMQTDFRDESLAHPRIRERFAASAATAIPSVAEILDGERRVALGVVVRADGLILTKGSELPDVIHCRVAGERYPAAIVTTDEAFDLALVRIPATGLVPIGWADADPAVGRWLVTPGAGPTPLAVGVVSVAARPIPPRLRYVGEDDATPALGVSFDEDPAVTGTILRRVSPSGPARRAGLRRGDRIVALDGLPTSGADDLAARLRSARIGDAVAITFVREGTVKETEAVLVSMADAQSDKPQRRDLAFSGPVSRRRGDFPRAFTHDSVIPADGCGGAVLGLDGRAVGLTVARCDRTTCYALPAAVVREALARLLPDRGR